MAIVDDFRKALEIGLAELSINEWAVAEARERMLIDVTPTEAFNSIAGVLNLAGGQTDEYAFASCCWLLMSLAELSDTTELPSNLEDVLTSLIPLAKKLGAQAELEKVAKWYRIGI